MAFVRRLSHATWRASQAFIGGMQPRDQAAAGHSLSMLSMVAAGVTLIFAVGQLWDPHSSVMDALLTAVAAVFIMLAGWAAGRTSTRQPLLWTVWPFGATAMIVALDVLTADASTAAQIFLIFPALYAASQLRRPGVVTVVVAVVAAEWAVTCSMLPFRQALVDASYMTAAIVATAALLTAAGERQEELVELLERQAAIDPLTGLVTRRVLDDAARSALSGAASASGTALILIDVDHFKSINDTYGHPGGDEVLVQLADVLVACSRSTDVVSRLGGDEIALLLPACSATALAARAEEVLNAVRRHTFVVGDGRHVKVSVSGGLAHAPTDAADLASLYAAADRALYRAKHLGRDQIDAGQQPGRITEFTAGADLAVVDPGVDLTTADITAVDLTAVDLTAAEEAPAPARRGG